jgi:hypothetical protein
MGVGAKANFKWFKHFMKAFNHYLKSEKTIFGENDFSQADTD